MPYVSIAGYHGVMSESLAVFDPDEIVSVSPGPELPGWVRVLMDRVQSAAACGQTVTLSAEERMLTPEQVGRRMNMHRSTVVRKISAGEIKATKVGNRHRIPYSEFLRFREQALDDLARFSAPDVEAELFGDR